MTIPPFAHVDNSEHAGFPPGSIMIIKMTKITKIMITITITITTMIVTSNNNHTGQHW